MVPARHAAVVLALLLTLIGVAVPPVVEDHLEAGFCSADCPVQQTGHGVGIATGTIATLADRTPPSGRTPALPSDVSLGTIASTDAARAPPVA